jgi:hypothetical protein
MQEREIAQYWKMESGRKYTNSAQLRRVLT